jgi:TolB protein
MKRTIFLVTTFLGGCIFALSLIYAQTKPAQISGDVNKRVEKPSIAVPDFRGAGDSQRFMATVNSTLFSELQNSGQLTMVAKTLYPLQVPQQPSDFRPPVNGRSQGPWLSDWSGPPVNANYLAYGYAASQNNQLVLYGWLYDVRQTNTTAAQLIGKIYAGSPDEDGALKVAREFAADILKYFGAESLIGTKIYFVSNRTGNKEIWSMDYDGKNQKQFTSYRTITSFPAISSDGTKIAFTTYPLGRGANGKAVTEGQPQIFVHSLETGRKLVYYNQQASMNAASDFMPDNRHLLIYSTAGGTGFSQIFVTDLDGSGLRGITHSRALEVEAKVNPKTGSDIVFVSGRGGTPQIYRMNIDGTDVARLSTGEGDAVNPAWSPDGQHIAFAWTRGYEPGNFNIFVMDVASREVVQLTHGAGRNEHPSWAPDGIHIVFSSTRGRNTQIYSTLANGGAVQQLTTQGNNDNPVWSRATH